MSIEAMKQALEALETCHWDYDYEEESYKTFDEDLVNDASEALRQAIEEAEKQEPFGYFQLDLRMDAWVQNRDNKKGVPFYTAPPKREWVGLTDEEIVACGWCDLRFARAIEAKLRERNT